MSPPTPRQRQKSNSYAQEIGELISGACGGFLFGIPLLYTMEVWFIGSYVKPHILLTILLFTYLVLFLLNSVEGFRGRENKGTIDTIADSFEALAIGMLCATLMLVLLQRISWQNSLEEALGKIIFEGVPFAFGVALSRSTLSGDKELPRKKRSSQHQKNSNAKRLSKTDSLADLITTLIGALIIAFSIAPTDEVSVLAAAASPPWLLLLIAASLVISYTIVFAAGFTNQQKRRRQQGLFQNPFSETIISYLVSLLASVLMLWFFQKLSFADPWAMWLDHAVILGLPAAVGGAAGRLIV